MDIGGKIMTQRKLRGWSQEELANRLQVSRQSVSKWESGASTPDLDRIVAMSQLFGVSTDYLLTGQSLPDEELTSETLPCVTREEALDYLDRTRRYAPRIAGAVAALVVSPAPLILMGPSASMCPAVCLRIWPGAWEWPFCCSSWPSPWRYWCGRGWSWGASITWRRSASPFSRVWSR